ncbi:MAG: hypothetical protein HYZ63_02470 [Candidatus Andersenbacteria bacterium]|nr:hypothetical protein [Candidatus Andersenbacteria bacterium]
MATSSADDQKAAQLSWDRRQSATMGRAKDTLRAMGNPGKGENFSTRNFLAMGQNMAAKGKPMEQKLREEGGKQLGKALGGFVGSLLPGLGSAAGAIVGGILGKRLGGSWVGKLVGIGLVVATVVLMIALPVAGLLAICNEFRITLAAASYVNNNANSLYTMCKTANYEYGYLGQYCDQQPPHD